MDKPEYCRNCKFVAKGYGYCPDTKPDHARVAFMFAAPTSEAITEQHGLGGKMGWYIFKNFIEPAGFKMNECIVGHVLRCKLPFFKGRPQYPTGAMRHHAEAVCRKYDYQHGREGKLFSLGIGSWNPNIFVITFAPSECHNVPAYYRQIQRDVQKAAMFADKGFRPCVLFGSEAMTLFAPFTHLNGGLKAWRGHFFESDRWDERLVTDTGKITFLPA